MSRTNYQAKIVSKEQLVPRANKLVIKRNNQRVASNSHITDTMLRFVVEILRDHKLYNLVSLNTTVLVIYLHQFWITINHNKNNHAFTFELDNHTFTLTPRLLKTILQMPPPNPNNTNIQPPSEIQILKFIKTLGYDEDPKTKLIAISKMVTTRLYQPWRAILSVLNRYFASLIWDEFEWKMVERSSRPSKMSKLLYTCFTKLIIDYLLSLNKIIHHSDYKFGMEVPDAMISDSIKKKTGYKYYMAKKVEIANVPKKIKKDVVPRKTRSLTIAKETVVEGSANETDDANESDMGLSNDNTQGDDDAASKENSLSHNNSTTKLPTSHSKEADAKGEKEYKDVQLRKAFEKGVQTKVLTEIKKLLPTHILNAIANYVKPRLNTSVLEVMKTNQINLFTQSSISTNDLLEMDIKLKLLNRIHLNKLNYTHTTHQKLYDTLYESIILDQDALNAQVAQSSFHKRTSRRNRSHVVIVQHDTPTMQHLDKADTLIQKHSNPEWFPKKSGLAKGRMTWFDLFLKSDIDKDENHILGPSTVSIAKKYYKEGIEDRIPERWRKEVSRYHFEALNGIHHWEENIIDLFKEGMSVVTEGNIFSDLRIKSFVRIDVLHFNNSLLMFIKITMIKNKIEDIQLGVESYQRTLNLTKPTMFFEGIDQRIPFTMTAMYKVVVYLNQYNIKSLIKLSDGTLVKIQENLIDMLSKNKLGNGNKRLKGRDQTDYDVKSSREMLKKIDEVLRHIEQLRRLEEYVGGRPKTVNPCTFVRPL
ncbi:hypothetical protein Tco_0691996 [Tanacetum coccineum]